MTQTIENSERKRMLLKGLLQFAVPIVPFLLMFPFLGIGPCGPSIHGLTALPLFVLAAMILYCEGKAIHNFQRTMTRPTDKFSLSASLGLLIASIAFLVVALFTIMIGLFVIA